MKIAFILSHTTLSPTNGIVSQALTWKAGLEEYGHSVILVDMWNKNDWKCFDVLHFFGFSVYMSDFINAVYLINPNIIVSPILDPNYSIYALKLYSKWGVSSLRLTNPFHALNTIKHKVKKVLVRSEFEKEYMVKGFGFEDSKCKLVPLSFNLSKKQAANVKENFCLHVSLLVDERKNVKRLIQAAIKYKFKLVLGGKLRNIEEEKLLKSWIGTSENIEFKGFLTNDELIDLYSKAKVFALPSTNEGVGIVAMEAASMGCDIVITKLGGPKEYYNGMAKIVNPYSVDEIGEAVLDFMKGTTFQPQLGNYIQENYSLSVITSALLKAYK